MTNTKFPILVFLLLFWATSVLAEADLASQDVSIFGKAVSSSQLDFDGPVEFRVVGDRLVVRTGSPRDKEAKIAVYDGETMQELWSVTGPWQVYVTGYSRPSLILSEIVAEGIANILVYDLEGELLFSKDKFDGSLYSSPGGTYFYTDFAGVHFNRFLILNRQGEAQGWSHTVGSPWTAAAFNDSVVVWSSVREARFISITTGSTLATISAPTVYKDRRTDPLIYESPGGTGVLFDWNNNCMYVNQKMEIGWIRNQEHNFRGVAFSQDGKYLALFESEDRTSGTLNILESATGRTLSAETLSANWFENWHFMKLLDVQNSFLCLSYPSPEAPDSRSPYIWGYSTAVFQMDPETGQLLDRTVHNGYLRIIDGVGDLRSFSITRNYIATISKTVWQDESVD